MARGKKTLTLEEQLEKITNEIEELETNLKDKKDMKKNLEAQIKANRLEQLDKLISSSGMSLEDVKELLSKAK